MLYGLNMRAVCWPVLLVSAALLCLDFAHALGRRESTALLRRQRRSGTSGLGDLSERKVKRSEGSVGDTPCLSLQGHGARLQQDTHTVRGVRGRDDTSGTRYRDTCSYDTPPPPPLCLCVTRV